MKKLIIASVLASTLFTSAAFAEEKNSNSFSGAVKNSSTETVAVSTLPPAAQVYLLADRVAFALVAPDRGTHLIGAKTAFTTMNEQPVIKKLTYEFSNSIDRSKLQNALEKAVDQANTTSPSRDRDRFRWVVRERNNDFILQGQSSTGDTLDYMVSTNDTSIKFQTIIGGLIHRIDYYKTDNSTTNS